MLCGSESPMSPATDDARHDRLTDDELVQLVGRVFAPTAQDQSLAVITDLPDAELADHSAWATRRQQAAEWVRRLDARRAETGLAAHLVLYRNVRLGNADLPEIAWLHDANAPLPADADALDPARALPFDDVLGTHPIVLAPTELSATAPLKLAARQHGLRAATMPGFVPAMVPALRLDYVAIDRRVRTLADLLDRAEGAEITFRSSGETMRLSLDPAIPQRTRIRRAGHHARHRRQPALWRELHRAL